MTQRTIDFERPSNRTATSRAAADSMREVSGGQESAVLFVVKTFGKHGLTREEISNIRKLGLASVCARVSSLLRKGKLVETGDTRPTSSGRRAAVLVSK